MFNQLRDYRARVPVIACDRLAERLRKKIKTKWSQTQQLPSFINVQR
jgi:hypothetical protein